MTGFGLKTISFSVGETDSEKIDLGGAGINLLYLPPEFTAATLTFKSSWNGIDYYPVYDSFGSVASVVANPSTYVVMDAGTFYCLPYLQVISSVAQTNSCVLRGLLRG